MALRCHPDHNQSPEATEEFQFLARAHETLSNADKRRNYDSGGVRNIPLNRPSSYEWVMGSYNRVMVMMQ
jgi:curved DNA-binding protein CbpA